MRDYEVMIIGAGVSGAAIARELSRYQVKCLVLEKEEDVCCGTSKANSAIIHAGYDALNGSMMAKMNVEGNAMMDKLSEELDFPFKRNGSLVLCFSEEDMPGLQKLYDNGVANGVPGLQILNKEEVFRMESNVSDDVYAALYAPSAGIVCPFHLNIALAENAYTNGVEFKFDTEVLEIEKEEKQEQSLELIDLVQRLQRTFATKVSAIGNDNKGRIYIDYYTRDDLDRIVELLTTLERKNG